VEIYVWDDDELHGKHRFSGEVSIASYRFYNLIIPMTKNFQFSTSRKASRDQDGGSRETIPDTPATAFGEADRHVENSFSSNVSTGSPLWSSITAK
jgi:hypothetical protein